MWTLTRCCGSDVLSMACCVLSLVGLFIGFLLNLNKITDRTLLSEPMVF